MAAKRNPYGRTQIDGEWFRLNKSGKTGAKLVRCSNTMTEAEFTGWVLSGLRARTKFWQPANDAWKLNSRPNESGVGRHKIEHQCNHCKNWYPKKTKKSKIGIELDHVVPIGGLNDFSKAEQWIERAFVEVNGYQKLCTVCHQIKTQAERKTSDE